VTSSTSVLSLRANLVPPTTNVSHAKSGDENCCRINKKARQRVFPAIFNGDVEGDKNKHCPKTFLPNGSSFVHYFVPIAGSVFVPHIVSISLTLTRHAPSHVFLPALTFAHLLRWAALIRARPSAEIRRPRPDREAALRPTLRSFTLRWLALTLFHRALCAAAIL